MKSRVNLWCKRHVQEIMEHEGEIRKCARDNVHEIWENSGEKRTYM